MNAFVLLDTIYKPLSIPAGLLILAFGLLLFLRGRKMVVDLQRQGKANNHGKFLRTWGVVGMLVGAVLMVPFPMRAPQTHATHEATEAYAGSEANNAANNGGMNDEQNDDDAQRANMNAGNMNGSATTSGDERMQPNAAGAGQAQPGDSRNSQNNRR